MRPGQELPPRTRSVEAPDLAAYAEASGDRNPLHLDEAFARSVGFPSVIAHGMLTLGHLGAALRDWAVDGEVIALRAQFRAPVFPGETIVARGRVRAVAGDVVTLDVWVEVERDGRIEEPVRRGEAEIRLV
ncbi:MAG: MaoC/PaaZ C-terminal domain-containing protein [Actinomycetota bacterium]